MGGCQGRPRIEPTGAVCFLADSADVAAFNNALAMPSGPDSALNAFMHDTSK